MEFLVQCRQKIENFGEIDEQFMILGKYWDLTIHLLFPVCFHVFPIKFKCRDSSVSHVCVNSFDWL